METKGLKFLEEALLEMEYLINYIQPKLEPLGMANKGQVIQKMIDDMQYRLGFVENE
jgi:hypothetical protein